MKKFIYTLAAMATIFGAASCSSNTEKKAEAETAVETTTEPKTEVYSGVLPAADADGMRYTVTMDYTDADKGTFTMQQTALTADDASATGYTDGTSFDYKGDFTVGTKDDTKYIKLTGTMGDETQTEDFYFIIESDSTITFTGAEPVKIDTPLNYTLSLVK